MTEVEQIVITIARMVVPISKKRCGYYAHPCQDEYKMRKKRHIYIKNDVENPKSPKHNPRR